MIEPAARLAEIQARIAAAASLARRKEEEITLVAISKTHPPERIVPLIEAGQRCFGENRVQEAEAYISAANVQMLGPIMLVIVALMILQGGFGGGHGPSDHAIWLIAMPWSWVSQKTGFTTPLFPLDWILFPWAVNFYLIRGLWAVWDRLIRSGTARP